MTQILGAILLLIAAAMSILTAGMLLPFSVPLGMYGMKLLGVMKAQ